MRTTAVRRLCFSAGHRLLGHEGGCRHVHGHNYVAFIHAEVENDGELDSVGRVIDFSVLKERVGGWINKLWDHGFLINAFDQTLIDLLVQEGNKIFHFEENPTAEVIAKYLLLYVCPRQLQGTGVRVYKVELWETENCYAVAEIEQ